ncbi:uncharacterized protein [Palaemon carinicauda]|uniref:uncharacterized protein n=1 Tax=Palaemon carinicauda TaxID=392227 RepID=UPI0035B59451
MNQEKMPEEWRRSLIIPIYKGKGGIQESGNYRGIKLIGHTTKIWEKIIEKRLRDETTIGEEQFGFMPRRGTGSALSPYLFDLVMDVVTQGIRDRSPGCMLFADNVILCSTRREVVEEKLKEWRREIENRGLKINMKETEYLILKNGENGERNLSEEEVLEVLFLSSDEEEPSISTYEAVSVLDDLHDAATWQEEEEEAQLLAANLEGEVADVIVSCASFSVACVLCSVSCASFSVSCILCSVSCASFSVSCASFSVSFRVSC